MLAMRRTALSAPRYSRSCAFLTKMKAMKAETDKLATTLPDGLKEIAQSGVRAATRQKKKSHWRTARSNYFPCVRSPCADGDRCGPDEIRDRAA